MKKSSLIVNVVLIIAVAVLYVFHFCCGPKGSVGGSGSDQDTSMVAERGDIVYIQMDSLVQKYDMYHDLKAEYEAKVKSMDADFTSKGKSFERRYLDFQDKAQKGLITRSEGERLQSQLAQEQQTLAQTGERMRNDLAEQEIVMYNRIQDAILTYVKKYNVEKGYSIILSTNGATPILYGYSGLDITNDVLNGLNQEYISTRNAEKK